MTTVFDIAMEMIERSGGRIEAVKLQKLCFYAFGWYAHLTGRPLFSETIYAMKFGPVVGELLSAHAGHRYVDAQMIETQLRAREDTREVLDPYKAEILDAVWTAYGNKESFELAGISHQETVWGDAWHKAERSGSKRGDLPQEAVISYFLDRQPRQDEELDLPPAQVAYLSEADLADINAQSKVHRPFVEAIRALREVA